MIVNGGYDIGEIENALWQAFKTANVCPVVYPNRRPSLAALSPNSFVVVRSVTEIIDKTAFGRNICRAEVYVKEIGGVKDSANASLICKKIMNALPIKSGKYYFDYISNMSLGLDGTGYDVEAVNINLIITQ